MDSNERYRIISTGRGGDFRNLVRDMTNDPRDFPTKSELKARIAEIYPGDEHAAMRQTVYDKLVKFAEYRRNGADLMELRGIGDEYVLKLEQELAEDDQLLPAEDTEPVDVAGMVDAIDNYDPTQKGLRAVSQSMKNDELAANLARQRAGL